MKKYLLPTVFALTVSLVTVGIYHTAFVADKINTVETVVVQSDTPRTIRTNNGLIPSANIDLSDAAEMTVNTVVHVKTARRQEFNRRQMDPFHEFFFGMPRQQQPRIVQGTGSGVILSEDGIIVTNNHVIDGAQNVSVTLNNNKSYDAEVIGTDPTTDLAVLKIDARNLPSIEIGNSDNVRLGEWVLAVGNPFNLTSTVTAGIVSAKGRNINIIPDQTAIESFLQTDAAVNPGNSGGALVNPRGELIGINTAISTHTGSFEGYSFAIPSNIVRKVVDDLIEYGHVQRAFLGVSISDVNSELQKQYELKATNGVYVSDVTKESAAEQAGIKAGDVIIKIDDRGVARTSELLERIASKRPGDNVSVMVNRDGKLRTFDVTLKNKRGTTEILRAEDLSALNTLGIELEEVANTEKQKLRIKNGVKISKINSQKLKGLKVPEGFVIVKLNNQLVYSVDDVNGILSNLKPGDGVLIQGVHPTGQPGYFGFGL